MVSFDFQGTVEVEVMKVNGQIDQVDIRPLYNKIQYVQSDNKIRFELDRPRKLSIEVNGERFHNLHLFANSLEKWAPKPDDLKTIYVKPGIHRVDDLLCLFNECIVADGVNEVEYPDVLYFGSGLHQFDKPQWMGLALPISS